MWRRHVIAARQAEHYLACYEGRLLDPNASAALVRKATGEQLLLPAPDKAALEWKRKASSSRGLPVSQQEITDAIRADEEFLASHPLQVRRKRIGGNHGRSNAGG
jgi:hypothetical protein